MKLKVLALPLIGGVAIAGGALAAAMNTSQPAPIMPLSGMILYHDAKLHFAVAYPPHWTVNANYKNTMDTPNGQEIGGVSFTVPASRTTGTNLGGDTSFSVQILPSGKCEAKSFLSIADSQSIVKDSNRTYSYATAQDAGAGNRYDISVYALAGTQPCMAVEYFIHYSAIENYDPGTVKPFDEPGMVKLFDKMRRSLAVMK